MNQTTYAAAFKLAKQKLREGDRATAIQLGRLLVAKDPQRVEAWLLLGGLSEPEQSLAYVRKAYQINPDDPRVKQAVQWALNRQHHQTQPINTSESQGEKPIGETTPDEAPEKAHTPKKGKRILWGAGIRLVIITASIILLSFLNPGMLITRTFNPLSQQNSEVQATSTPTFTELESVITHSTATPQPTLETQIISPTTTPTSTPTPTPIADLWGCQMEMRFTSGPLAGEGTTFTMLDETYFQDKGDKFDTGKNTGIYYQDQKYVILHSGLIGWNPFSPLEVEFIRAYLENRGNESREYIEGQIDELTGSEIVWRCDGEIVLITRLVNIVRLSYEASTRLWLDPFNIQDIIRSREGLEDEWIGDMGPDTERSIYLGFCGWGPPHILRNRQTYYRYVLRFEKLN